MRCQAVQIWRMQKQQVAEKKEALVQMYSLVVVLKPVPPKNWHLQGQKG